MGRRSQPGLTNGDEMVVLSPDEEHGPGCDSFSFFAKIVPSGKSLTHQNDRHQEMSDMTVLLIESYVSEGYSVQSGQPSSRRSSTEFF